MLWVCLGLPWLFLAPDSSTQTYSRSTKHLRYVRTSFLQSLLLMILLHHQVGLLRPEVVLGVIFPTPLLYLLGLSHDLDDASSQSPCSSPPSSCYSSLLLLVAPQDLGHDFLSSTVLSSPFLILSAGSWTASTTSYLVLQNRREDNLEGPNHLQVEEKDNLAILRVVVHAM